MRKDSYPFLITVIVSLLLLIYGATVWRVEIYRATFLNHLTVRYMIYASLLLSTFLSLLLIWRGAAKEGRYFEYLKIYAGAFVLLMFFFGTLLITITYMLPGEVTSYSSPYKYASGSSRSCSGADVDDKDLKENIRICYPLGNYEYDEKIFVRKRTNSLGIVVLFAMTTP